MICDNKDQGNITNKRPEAITSFFTMFRNMYLPKAFYTLLRYNKGKDYIFCLISNKFQVTEMSCWLCITHFGSVSAQNANNLVMLRGKKQMYNPSKLSK